jgi:hypothetical protein
MRFSSSVTGHWILESDGSHDVLSMTRNGIASIELGEHSGGSMRLEIINGGVYFYDSSGQFELNYATDLIWRGGILSSTETLASFLDCTDGINPHNITISDVDLSVINTGSLCNISGDATTYCVHLSRCKIDPDTAIIPTSPLTCGEIYLDHCSDGNRYYDFLRYCLQGTCKDETTIVRTGGASDGTTGMSVKMISSANCAESYMALPSIPIYGWTDSTTEKTFTIEGVWDSATNIQDDEIWMELEYPANATDGLGAVVTDKCAILGTPADQTTSAATWTTTGLTEYRSETAISPNSMTNNTTPSPYVASTSNSSVNAFQLFDGTNSRWYVSGTSGWCKIDLGSDIRCGGYGIQPSTWPTQAPRDWTFQGSDDGSTWTTLDTQTDQTFFANTLRKFDLSSHGTYRYYKLDVTDSNGGGYVDMEEFVVYGSEGDLANPNEFKLSVTVTPGKAGPITARVYLAKPSTSVYIDPLITES